jgi:uncharacterized membrane protein
MQPTLTVSKRIVSVDVLRGLVMVIMALDHTRDFFSSVLFNPLDLTQTSPQLFLTRWITHFCAPIFVFLSGCSVFLSMQNGKSKSKAAGFLVKRGIWLIFVEIAIINLVFSFDPSYHFVGLQVIWAIGWSMLFLAAIIHLKPFHIGLIGLIIIFGHNALDGIRPESFGRGKLFWMILHEQRFVPYGNGRLLGVFYPIIPWIGVMAAGYAFGWFFTLEAAKRRSWFLKIGLGCIAAFIIIRFTNLYGDASLWKEQGTWWKTALSFINCTKYPPSLLYLLMTIGPGILLLNLFEKVSNGFTKILSVYGYVPFFYYILHFFLIHLAAVFTSKAMDIEVGTIFNPTPGWGFRLLIVYLVWILIVVSLYFPCKWFMGIKKTRKDWWLSYL